MANLKRRVRTIQTLIASQMGHLPCEPAIQRELSAIANAHHVRGRRRELLELLHTTRALDTTLRHRLHQKGIPIPQNQRGLGAYLILFVGHTAPGVGHLVESRRASFQRSIVDKRNVFAHTADTYPSVLEADRLLTEMHSCLTEVLRL